ncbi:MAG: hypothetical protein GMKNLPBB_01837 [Myxococcota bacterium]|nr:hypothetical protein [Myxococcota bacterium]
MVSFNSLLRIAARALRLAPLPAALLLLALVIIRRPGDAAWRETLDQLRPQLTPDDLVLVAPAHELRNLSAGESAPLMAAERDVYLDTRGVRTLWRLSRPQPDRPQEAIGPGGAVSLGANLINGYVGERVLLHKGVAVDRFPVPANNLLRHLDKVEAAVSNPDGSWSQCRRAEDVLQCGEQGWQFVGERKLVAAGQETSCVWTHPYSGRTLRLLVREWPLDRIIHFYAMFSDGAVQDPPAETILVKISDGAGWNHDMLHPARVGAQLLMLQPPAGRAAGDIFIEISSPNDAKSHFCLNLES